MLSPTRSSAQTILKAVVTTASTVIQESTRTITEQKEESIDADDSEPSKKKFKDDTEVEVETSVTTQTTTTTTQIRPRPLKKRKVCVSFGYCGAGYFGLQRNAKDKVHRTIEDELVEALVKVDAIPQAHADDMSKMAFQRAARTDKGVSAVANLVSLKLSPLENLTELVNEQLPKQIRMFGVKRVAASFNSKNSCDARTYIYILPTYAFCPIEEITSESYRVTSEILQLIKDVSNEYLGSHNFHNFTSGKKFTDPSARRHIFSINIADPFIEENVEFTIITIKGQSFMLHQIRKMISLIIAIVRGIASRDTIQQAYNADKIDVPKAPPLGLVLEKLHYDRYDKKFGKDGQHEALTWEQAETEIKKFKEDIIIPHIIKKEITDKSMFSWLFFGPMLSRYEHTSPYFSIVTYIIPTLLGRLRHLPFVQKILDNTLMNELDDDDDENGGDE
ncbi:unnamed protein product [Rotaria sordida]|uniref:Pseudouridylate synthase 1 homolog n=1 Tax=Rotaria sordida TaxID=392033 RepID=A0A814Q2C7_9BILA|nr:unnamed protein product [Rotaria sordida]CAF1113792.1 unnamed protein product [Rotaria sordida]